MAPHRGLPPYHTTRIDHKGSEASEAAKTWKTSFGCFAGFLSVFTCCVLHPGGCAGSGHRAQQPNDAGGAAILPGNEAAPNGKNLGDPGQAKQGHPGVPGRPGSEDRLPAQPVKADGAKGGHGGEPHYRAAKAAEEKSAGSGGAAAADYRHQAADHCAGRPVSAELSALLPAAAGHVYQRRDQCVGVPAGQHGHWPAAHPLRDGGKGCQAGHGAAPIRTDRGHPAGTGQNGFDRPAKRPANQKDGIGRQPNGAGTDGDHLAGGSERFDHPAAGAYRPADRGQPAA